MKLSRLVLLLALLIFFSSTPRSCHAIRTSFSAPSTSQQGFRSPFSSSPFAERAKEFESQKRRVPTGSNPLHNKRRITYCSIHLIVSAPLNSSSDQSRI
ncbi:CLAVATA3/ESR (CLE)-RELATED PROTEIN 20 [Salix purpurea]|uniref:CLAVATA3/ESR (CLE)-RELATED PROTEIN 20 n=1 Tax=Salix purpurea TaxID=77065 RepID=A0A9Q0P3A3_SALPP|nr:CLAVATA3/ESR (CLE)-RELATED PROTEIN 20 [Salix purpurea]